MRRQSGGRRYARNWAVRTLKEDLDRCRAVGEETGKPSLPGLRKRWNQAKDTECANTETGLRDIVTEPLPITLPPGLHRQLVGPALAAAVEAGTLEARDYQRWLAAAQDADLAGITATRSSEWSSRPASLLPVLPCHHAIDPGGQLGDDLVAVSLVQDLVPGVRVGADGHVGQARGLVALG
jgi:hypothetical protein